MLFYKRLESVNLIHNKESFNNDFSEYQIILILQQNESNTKMLTIFNFLTLTL